ncbi:MAG: hypothetical protein KA715_00700 [Xanthomonadaceae bacterium]|nr:hypothetical protein [Xanthomonadaceae bacterium]
MRKQILSFIFILLLSACEKQETLQAPITPVTQASAQAEKPPSTESPCVVATKNALVALHDYDDEKGAPAKALALIEAINRLDQEEKKEKEANSSLPSYMKKQSSCETRDYHAFHAQIESSKFRSNQTVAATAVGLRLAFTIEKIADGALAEGNFEALGFGLLANPKEFLRQLKEVHGEKFCVSDYFGHTGDYDEESDKPRKELLKKQKEALASINDPDLAAIQKVCLSSIK